MIKSVSAVHELSRSLTFLLAFFILYSLSSPGGFLCFLPIICLAYTMLSLPLSLLGILRRAHMHRNTSHLSSRKLVFAHSFWNLPVGCLFCFCKLKPPPPKPCLSIFFVHRNTFSSCLGQQNLQPLCHITLNGMMRWFVPLRCSWSHPVKGYVGLHRAVMEGLCICG